MRRWFSALGMWAVFSVCVARADTEGWLIVDSRLPVHSRSESQHKVSLRVLTDFRVAQRSAGLQQALMRLGFAWEPRPWLLVGSQTNMNTQSSDGKQYAQEWRQEFEATLASPLYDPVWLEHRHRLELRQHSELGFSPRYRLLLRFNLKVRWPLQPYLFDEMMLVPGPYWLNQNRLSAGLFWRARKNLVLEVGYMWRLRNVGPADLVSDHAPRIAITFVPSNVERVAEHFFASE